MWRLIEASSVIHLLWSVSAVHQYVIIYRHIFPQSADPKQCGVNIFICAKMTSMYNYSSRKNTVVSCHHIWILPSSCVTRWGRFVFFLSGSIYAKRSSVKWVTSWGLGDLRALRILIYLLSKETSDLGRNETCASSARMAIRMCISGLCCCGRRSYNWYLSWCHFPCDLYWPSPH